MKKAFILDTNILISTEGRALFGFDNNIVVLPSIVIEELDNLKTAPGEKGYQARESIRFLDRLILHDQGDELNMENIDILGTNGGKLWIYSLSVEARSSYAQNLVMHADWYDSKKPDNIILATAYDLKVNTLLSRDVPVILVTNDAAMRIKALTFGIEVQTYYNDQVAENFSYSGRTTIEMSLSLDKLFKENSINISEVATDEKELPENMYACLTNGYSSALCYIKNDKFNLLKDFKAPIFGITPKNQGQRYALHALLAPADEIPLVILKGAAGTGKTLLSIAAALENTYTVQDRHSDKAMYDKIVCTRSNTLSDEDIGFLPGTLEDKMMPLLAPFFDNLEYLFGKDGDDKEQVSMHINDLINTGVIEITSLSYIRGRSLSNTYIIIDEAQNLSRLQAVTISTRVSIGSKLVFLGDPNQIDNPNLDKRNNGLVYLSEKFKGNRLCAQVEFNEDESVRSELALEAIKILQ